MSHCWHAHVGAEVGWDEAVLYVGVGSYLRPTCPRSSVDQQLPPFLASLAEQQQVRAVLVDPQFVDGELPLALRLDPAGWAVWRPDLGHWDSLPSSQARPQHRPGPTYKKGRLLLGVLPGCVEYDTPTGRRDDRTDGVWRSTAEATSLLGCLYAHARAVLKRGGWVYLGIYCQPYYANEDNLAALDLYHALLDDYYGSAKEVTVEERVCRLQGLVLADYADEERGS